MFSTVSPFIKDYMWFDDLHGDLHSWVIRNGIYGYSDFLRSENHNEYLGRNIAIIFTIPPPPLLDE